MTKIITPFKKFFLIFPRRSEPWFLVRCIFVLGCLGGFFATMVVAFVLIYFSAQVPDYTKLQHYKPKIITKIYTSDSELLAEYARERRIYTPIEEVPESVVQAFLAAEDSGFYSHAGYDLKGIVRAMLVNTFTSGKQGASTITQQVAKTFFLSSERRYSRKIKELVLARRMEKLFTKDQILEFYLNQIYLGHGAYGIVAAARTYYDKDLSGLTIGQKALLAGLPKAPSDYDPLRYPQQARWRRDVILRRMEAEGFITSAEATEFLKKDLELSPHLFKNGSDAPHFSEHVRRFIADRYGNTELYTAGLQVFTTIDLDMQKKAEDAVYRGLREYDRRHGYRGALTVMNILLGWENKLDTIADRYSDYKNIGSPAVVLEVNDEKQEAKVGVLGGVEGFVPLSAMEWARRYIDADHRGDKISKVSDVLSVGDVVMVKSLSDIPDKPKSDIPENHYSLEQIPEVQGALLAMDVHTGAVRAMVGGLDSGTGFNRAIQAKRQAGSSFKPFVYSMALENGYTPASIILDAPVVLQTGEMDEKWKPHNYSEKVYGPSTLRRGLEKSRNLMTIRLARDLGMRSIINYVRGFGLNSAMQPDLSTALGSSSFSLLEMTGAYGVFPNHGYKVEPYFVERIHDSEGSIVFRHGSACLGCLAPESGPEVPPVDVAEEGVQVIPETTAFLMTDMLRGVVQNGTAFRARAVGHPVGAKTGTTNDYIDAWLMGFSADISVGVWVGFDKPQTMGRPETGSRASGPIWTYFMTDVLKRKPQKSFSVPEGVSFVRIDADTGGLPTKDTKRKILEVFETGTEPTTIRQFSSGGGVHEDEIDFLGIY